MPHSGLVQPSDRPNPPPLSLWVLVASLLAPGVPAVPGRSSRTFAENMNPSERLLPDREIAYNYTAAMHFAQRLEANLKAVLHSIDFSFEDLEETLNPGEIKRFKTFGTFLTKATTGALKAKLLQVGYNLPEEAWDLLNEACQTRNHLAHRYLEDLRLPPPNEEHRDAIIKELQNHAVLLYKAMMITQIARTKIENMSDQQHMHINEFLKECGVDPQKVNKGLWNHRDE